MEPLDDYIIPFKGLAEEVHQFHFEIDDAFFEELEYAEIQRGQVKVNLSMDKQERMMTLVFTLEGQLEVECDRCLEMFMMPVTGTRELFLKFGDAYQEEDDNIIILPREAYQFDVRPYLYEFLILLLPYRRIHPEDNMGQSTCDPAMLQLLNRHQTPEGTDARWDALRDLQNKLEE